MPLMKHVKLKEEQRAAVQAVRQTARAISRELCAGYDEDDEISA